LAGELFRAILAILLMARRGDFVSEKRMASLASPSWNQPSNLTKWHKYPMKIHCTQPIQRDSTWFRDFQGVA
jgi:hypothetical protein